MSAFIVSMEHIHAMVTAAKMDRDFSVYHEGNRYTVNTLDMCNFFGKILVAQNYRSVNFRCKETDEIPEYRFEYSMEHKPIEIIKACHCYDYQACETDDYDNTLAKAFSDALERHMIRKVPGYSAAPWGIEDQPDKPEIICLSDMLAKK